MDAGGRTFHPSTGLVMNGPRSNGLFVLPEDVLLIPMTEMTAEVRDQLEHQAGDHAVNRPLSRTPTSVVSGATARLLERFRTPISIVDAVISYAAAESLEPQRTLEDAFPALSGFVNTGLLLPAGSELAK